MADQTDEAANAAGRAAYARAKTSHWPPTEADAEAIGAVAGTAAGAVFGGPAGAALGGIIGTAVGSAIYSLAEAISNGLNAGYNPTAEYLVKLHATQVTIITTADRLAEECRTDREHELGKMIEWGLKYVNPDGTLPTNWRTKATDYGVAPALQALNGLQRNLFEASAARSAECETYKKANAPHLKEPPKRGAGIGTVVIAAAGLGGAIWLASLL